MEAQTIPTPIDREVKIARYTLIGTGVTAVVLFIIGGALMGAYANSLVCDVYLLCYRDGGLWLGGLIMLVLAAVVTVGFGVRLTLWLVRRNAMAAGSGMSGVRNGSGGEEAAEVQEVRVEPKGDGARTGSGVVGMKKFCVQCGTQIQAKFCAQCGAAAAV